MTGRTWWDAMLAHTGQATAATVCAAQALGVDSATVHHCLGAAAFHRAQASAIYEQFGPAS